MNIEVEKWILNDSEDVSFHVVKIDKCCDKLLNNEEYIDLTDEIDEGNEYTSNYKFKLQRDEEEYLGDGINNTTTYYKSIEYCPYCGKRINIKVIRTVDITDRMKELYKQKDILLKKLNNTDSIKGVRKLRESISNINNKMDSMYMSDCLEDIKKKGLI